MHTGDRVGPYEITARIGAGGMGEVFRARDTRLNRDVAVKVLPQAVASDPERLHRFEQEAKTLAALNYPHVLTIHDVGVHDGTPYLVSELLEGQTLREELNEGLLGLPKTSDYALQIASGLAAAHGKGIIHRDVKPENIFITTDGRVKILDFGLAKLRDSSLPFPVGDAMPGCEGPGQATTIRPGAQVHLNPTTPGLVLGTPAYMAPEQVRGEPADHRADIFAFGCVLYEMLSGTRAFQRRTPVESMSAVLNDTLPELSTMNQSIPEAYARIVDRCLKKSPEQRFQSALDLAFALEEARSTKSSPGTSDHRRRAGEANLHPDTTSPSRLARPVPRFVLLGVSVLLALGLGWLLIYQSAQAPARSVATESSVGSPATPATDPKSIAVLPFANISLEQDNDYFSDGITEEILNALARTPGLRVAARTSAFSAQLKNESVRRIGELLNVGFILEGSVRRAGNQLRITATLINAADGFQLWSDTFDRQAEDVFAIQTEVAQRVQEVLKVKLLPASNSDITLVGTDNLEAYDLYLRGRHFWNQRGGANLERARGLFQQATEKDPNFAAAYAGLASTYVLLHGYANLPAREAIAKGRAAARRALELDGRLPEAHAALGRCAVTDWDLVAGEQEYRKALSLNPNHGTARHWNALLLVMHGKYDQAIAENRRAHVVDPLSAVIQASIGDILYSAGRYEEALVEAEKTLRLAPDFRGVHYLRGRIFVMQRKFPEALAEFEKLNYVPSHAGHVYALMGRTNEARQALERVTAVSGVHSLYNALVHLGLGELDQAFRVLEQAAETRDADPRWIRTDPRFGELVRDRRYAALLKKFGLD